MDGVLITMIKLRIYSIMVEFVVQDSLFRSIILQMIHNLWVNVLRSTVLSLIKELIMVVL